MWLNQKTDCNSINSNIIDVSTLPVLLDFSAKYYIFCPNIGLTVSKDWLPLYVTTSTEILWPNIFVFNRIFEFLANYWILQSTTWFFLLNIGLIESKDWLQQYQQQYDRCFNSVNLTWQWGSLIPGGENKRKWTNLSTTIFSASYPAITHTRLQGCKFLAVEIFFLFFKNWFVCELIWS